MNPPENDHRLDDDTNLRTNYDTPAPRIAVDAVTTRRCAWRIPIYFGFGGVVVTVEPWTWRGIRKRLSRV